MKTWHVKWFLEFPLTYYLRHKLALMINIFLSPSWIIIHNFLVIIDLFRIQIRILLFVEVAEIHDDYYLHFSGGTGIHFLLYYYKIIVLQGGYFRKILKIISGPVKVNFVL